MAGVDLSEQQRDELTKLLGSPLDYPQEFKDWVPQFLAQNIPYLPIGQVSGAGKVQPWFAVVLTREISGTEKGVWGDLLATAGPRIDDVSGGEYLAIWGYTFEAGANVSKMDCGVSIDGNDPVAPAYIHGDYETDPGWSNWKACHITVPQDGAFHFVKLKYRFDDAGSGGDCNTSLRWIVLLRIR